MKDEDFIERKEKILLAALGKSWLWKASRFIIGIIPPVGALVMLIHCSLLSMGYREKLAEWIFDCSLRLHRLDHRQPCLWLLLGASSVRNLRSADFLLHRLPAFLRVRCFSPAAAPADGRPRAAALLRLHQEKGLE